MQNNQSIHIQIVADQAIMISWPALIHQDILDSIVGTRKGIEANFQDLIVDIVPAYHSLMVYPDLNKVTLELFINELEKQLGSLEYNTSRNVSHWKIPVCYDESLGFDLPKMSSQLKTDKHNIVRLHSMTTYLVHGLGFLPGFMYLGGLNEQLYFPRRNEPRPRISKGSVAIGGKQTGVYPINCPAGWNIIGNTPISFFDVDKKPPCFISVGDRIVFSPIDMEEYLALKQDIQHGQFNNEELLIHVGRG